MTYIHVYFYIKIYIFFWIRKVTIRAGLINVDGFFFFFFTAEETIYRISVHSTSWKTTPSAIKGWPCKIQRGVPSRGGQFSSDQLS